MNSSIKYEALDQHGEKVVSVFYGSEDEFFKHIKNQHFFLLSYKNSNKTIKQGTFGTQEFLEFSEEIVFLVESGVTLDNAIKLMHKNATTKIKAEFLNTILENLKEGNQFSLALENAAKKLHIDIGNMEILLLKTSERIGNILHGLKELQSHLEFKIRIQKSIKQAMAYPIFLITMSVLMVLFVFLFIVPKFATIFTPKEFELLPALSKIVLETGLIISNNIEYFFTIIGLVGLFLFVIRKKLKKYIYIMIIHIPLLKKLNIKLELSYLFSSLSLMLEGGIDIKQAMVNSSETITYQPLKQLILSTVEAIKKGETIAASFAASNLIPPNAIALIDAGENSATISKVFQSLSHKFADDFQDSVKKYISILEPLVIVLMGLVIAVIVVSIMLAVMSITDIA